jgi:hypothetical protein
MKHYDTRLYEAFIGKVYTNAKIYQTLNIIVFAKHYYDVLLHNIMWTILNDRHISNIT